MHKLNLRVSDMLPGDILMHTNRHGSDVLVLTSPRDWGLGPEVHILRADDTIAVFAAPGIYPVQRPSHRREGVCID